MENGIDVTLPLQSYSIGIKLPIHILSFMHRQFLEKAKQENVSLNQEILSHLSRGLGYAS